MQHFYQQVLEKKSWRVSSDNSGEREGEEGEIERVRERGRGGGRRGASGGETQRGVQSYKEGDIERKRRGGAIGELEIEGWRGRERKREPCRMGITFKNVSCC